MSTAASDSTATALIQAARQALDGGNAAAAAESAQRVVDRFASARTSSLALPILAEARLDLEDWVGARAAASRYARLFSGDDPRAVLATVLSARAYRGEGDGTRAVSTLLALPATVDGSASDALDLMRMLAAELDNEAVAALAGSVDARLLSTPIRAEYALSLWFQDEADLARGVAEQMIQSGAVGREAEVARGVLDGSVESVAGSVPVLGAMLAETGSPGLTEFSAGIREGVDVAVALYGAEARRPVRLEVMDNRGSAASADAVVARLENQGALAVVGPLLGTAVAAAAPARQYATPIISPTAQTLPAGQDGVYSMVGPDDGAARALAGYASSRGLTRVVVLRPVVNESIREAAAFRVALEDLGLQVVREIAYDSGATFFQAQLEEVASLDPDGLMLPLPSTDVELLAPQVTFFGLDTLGIQVMGTAAWTSDGVVDRVDARHTAGVVAAAATIPGSPTEGQTRFVEAYESQFRRTLRSPVPALGFDAAALILEAIRITGARTPEDVDRGLRSIRDYPGATGVLSVENGRIVRRHRLVRFDSTGVPVPLDGQGGN